MVGELARLLHPDARLVDAASGVTVAGEQLAARVAAAARAYQQHRPGVVFCLLAPDQAGVVRYLASQAAQRVALLLDPDLPAMRLRAFVDVFAPALVVGLSGTDSPPPGYAVQRSGELGGCWVREQLPPVLPHPGLGLLLTTSGSTGSPKLVRLSRSAVRANAESIAQALDIDGDEVAITSLPLHYTYGLSVLHSHLLRGAMVVLDQSGLTSRVFWDAINTHAVTSLAGVPYQYEMLQRLRFDPARYPSLRTLTQAGGRLRADLVLRFGEAMRRVGGRMYVMYGQTEATARMSVLPPERLADKPASVGLAIPGGRFEIRTPDGDQAEPGSVGEVHYFGPNVMWGYAESAEDLGRGDELGGALAAGDLGYLDDEGYLFLVGRSRRFAKVFGVRVSLDDVERMLAERGPLAAVAGEDRLVVVAEGADEGACAAIRAQIAESLGLHSSGITVMSVSSLPVMATGKVDYQALAGLL